MNVRKKSENQVDIVRSSAAEYLTFVAALGEQTDAIEVRYEDENVWLTQKLMATLYGVDLRTVNGHLMRIFETGELMEEATIRNFRIVQAEGRREVHRDVKHYGLQAIIALGCRFKSRIAREFRTWGKLNNPGFNPVEFDEIRRQMGLNRFALPRGLGGDS